MTGWRIEVAISGERDEGGENHIKSRGIHPVEIKVAMRGDRAAPSRLANTIHSFLNRLATERYPILRCGGVLKGFRMRVDWQLHRSFAYGSWEPEVVRSIQDTSFGEYGFWILAHRADFIPSSFQGLLGPEGLVLAFEPLPANFRAPGRKHEVEQHPKCDIRREAVSDARAISALSFRARSFPSSRAHSRRRQSRRAPVPAISLDDFVRQTGQLDPIYQDGCRGCRDGHPSRRSSNV